jgi:hypothetical protein
LDKVEKDVKGFVENPTVSKGADVLEDAAALYGAAKIVQSGARAAGAVVDDVADAVQAAESVTPRLVIGRGADLAKPGALGPGEFKLSWPPTATVRSEWGVNSGLLRQEMRNLRPIRDASPGNTGGIFTNAERNLLTDRGWTFDPKTNLWNPP